VLEKGQTKERGVYQTPSETVLLIIIINNNNKRQALQKD